MKQRDPVGHPLNDPHIAEYRALLRRQNTELRAELARVKASQLTRGGRWMRNLLFGVLIALLGILAAGSLLVYFESIHP